MIKCPNCANGTVKDLVVKKDGPNKDKKFQGCSERQCDFFNWGWSLTDENASEQPAPSDDPIENLPDTLPVKPEEKKELDQGDVMLGLLNEILTLVKKND